MNRVICFCALVFILCGKSYGNTTQPVVVLLSIDGFAYEYLHKHQPLNIQALSNNGILAKLQSVYPSKTFPNHLSIITGMYPINHGIAHKVKSLLIMFHIIEKIRIKSDLTKYSIG